MRQGRPANWNYIDGCMMTALLSMTEITGDRRHFDFGAGLIFSELLGGYRRGVFFVGAYKILYRFGIEMVIIPLDVLFPSDGVFFLAAHDRVRHPRR